MIDCAASPTQKQKDAVAIDEAEAAVTRNRQTPEIEHARKVAMMTLDYSRRRSRKIESRAKRQNCNRSVDVA